MQLPNDGTFHISEWMKQNGINEFPVINNEETIFMKQKESESSIHGLSVYDMMHVPTGDELQQIPDFVAFKQTTALSTVETEYFLASTADKGPVPPRPPRDHGICPASSYPRIRGQHCVY